MSQIQELIWLKKAMLITRTNHIIFNCDRFLFLSKGSYITLQIFFKYVRNTFLYKRTWPKYKKQSFPSQLIFLLKLSLSIYIFFLLVSSFNAKCKLNANKTDLSSDLGMSINCTHTFRTIDWRTTSGWTPSRGSSPEHGEKVNRSNKRNISFFACACHIFM